MIISTLGLTAKGINDIVTVSYTHLDVYKRQDVEYNNEEVYISFLRKKLKFIETDMVIETVRGVGYRLRGKNNETV